MRCFKTPHHVRSKQIINRQLTEQKETLEHTLKELKATQSQLIQSEKMASLGELTAGIAHEIQNPLNFVNNFSEVNKDLLREMDVEIEKGNFVEARQIARNVVDNEDKILQHGKRADAIVKGMLQHSRASSGHKEPIDLNVLADKYLRLAYQGFRAKEKNFNVSIQTNFDQSVGLVNVIPQDIGRVLLNLFNNAFYAVNEKKIQLGNSYDPVVSIDIKKSDGAVKIAVKDNGGGIPEIIRDKIFQPFFTTKPTGNGTGLGLSLSYDIIKGHGGLINAESVAGKGSEFIVTLPA